MAKIKTQDKHGSVGPSTFMTTKHGVVERGRTFQYDPKTPFQLNYRQIPKAVAGQWRGLSEAERAGWNALASQLRGSPSGANAHFKVNVTLANSHLPMRTTAPPVPVFGQLTCGGLLADDTPQLKLLQVSSTAPVDWWVLEACAPVQAGIQNVRNRFRQFLVLPGGAEAAVDLDLTAAYVQRFRTLPVRKRVCVRLWPMSDGFKGEPVERMTLVAARGG